MQITKFVSDALKREKLSKTVSKEEKRGQASSIFT